MTLGDNPILRPEDDTLGRGRAVGVLAALLRNDRLDTPIVVGIEGGWGSGRTSAMRLLQADLADSGLGVWFEARRHAGDVAALWRGLCGAVVARVQAALPADDADGRRRLEALAERLYRRLAEVERPGHTLDWAALAPRLLDRAVAGVSAAVSRRAAFARAAEEQSGADDGRALAREMRQADAAHVEAVERFRAALHELVAGFAAARWGRLVLFVDDLDRCPPKAALAGLEALKLFLDVPGCVAVIALDRRSIAEAVRTRQQPAGGGASGTAAADALHAIDRIIQVPFTLPPLTPEQMAGFVTHWCAAHGRDDIREHCTDLVARSTLPTPRGVKRTLTLLHLSGRLWAGGGDPPADTLRRLAVIAVLRVRFTPVHAEVLADPPLLRVLEADALNTGFSVGPGAARLLDAHTGLRELFAHRPGFQDLDDDTLTDLLYPGRRA